MTGDTRRPVRRALLSVSDKTGLVELGRGLAAAGVEIVSTGSTAATIEKLGVPVTAVSDLTGFPECLDGRVKTLHPLVHAGILADLRLDDHREQLERLGIAPFELVVVNLYPFTATVASGASYDECVEQIDIGGPTMVRAAAKNHPSVSVVTSPAQYDEVRAALAAGGFDLAARSRLAAAAFAHTAAYDAMIAARLSAEAGVLFPEDLTLSLRKSRDLRYGENPHQLAAFYALRGEDGAMTSAEQLHGKAASFNNMLDINAAWRIVADFGQPTVAIVKHQNPCGIASDTGIARAYERAFLCDSVSAFGGIVGSNRPVSRELAQAMKDTFYEAIIAPGYAEDALPLLRERKNLEILSAKNNGFGSRRSRRTDHGALDFKRVSGGMLVQTPDESVSDEANFKPVTERHPTLEELTDLIFAWRCVRHVTSNAIVLAKGLATVGVGPGQLSRVVAVEVAVRKAGENARLGVMASDAYFPFPDGIEVAARAGVTAIIQPGGSLRDQMMIDTANRYRMAMLFTGRRHFKH